MDHWSSSELERMRAAGGNVVFRRVLSEYPISRNPRMPIEEKYRSNFARWYSERVDLATPPKNSSRRQQHPKPTIGNAHARPADGRQFNYFRKYNDGEDLCTVPSAILRDNIVILTNGAPLRVSNNLRDLWKQVLEGVEATERQYEDAKLQYETLVSTTKDSMTM